MSVCEQLPDTMTIICICGTQVELENEGGQYPESYTGTCSGCGHRWSLTSITAALEEADSDSK